MKKGIGLVLLGIVLLLAFRTGGDPIVAAMGWIEARGALGWGVFIALYVGATVLLVPGLLLTLGAGVIWGPLLGTALVSVASTLGATAAFLTGRYLARDWVEERLQASGKVAALDRALAGQAFQIILLTRLSPVFPFNLLNYLYSLSAAPLGRYVAASWIGMLPATVLYVYIGSLVGSLRQLGEQPSGGEGLQRWFFWLGLGVTVLVTVRITKMARRALADKGFEGEAAHG